jgi:hypothetical protein
MTLSLAKALRVSGFQPRFCGAGFVVQGLGVTGQKISARCGVEISFQKMALWQDVLN